MAVQPAACDRANASPAICSVALRAGPELAASARRTAPLPEPLPPETVTHEGTPLTVQLHAAGAVISTLTSSGPRPAL